MKYVIDETEVSELLKRFGALEDEIWRDYGVNRMTDREWQQKYPGIPENRAAGKLVREYAFKYVLAHQGGIIVADPQPPKTREEARAEAQAKANEIRKATCIYKRRNQDHWHVWRAADQVWMAKDTDISEIEKVLPQMVPKVGG
jgi:hypothetical protein